MPFRIARRPVKISVSIGISCYPRDGATLSDLLHAADRAMYIAKSSGDNYMHFHDVADRTAERSA